MPKQIDFSHRLSRTLGYDGQKAEARKEEKLEPKPKYESKIPIKDELEMIGRKPIAKIKEPSFVDRAIARAKKMVGSDKPSPPPENKRRKQIEAQEKAAESPDLGNDGTGLGDIGDPNAVHVDNRPNNPLARPAVLGTDGGKMEKTMHEFKRGSLHSGSKKGPKVTNRKQAIAIGMSQARKAGE